MKKKWALGRCRRRRSRPCCPSTTSRASLLVRGAPVISLPGSRLSPRLAALGAVGGARFASLTRRSPTPSGRSSPAASTSSSSVAQRLPSLQLQLRVSQLQRPSLKKKGFPKKKEKDREPSRPCQQIRPSRNQQSSSLGTECIGHSSPTKKMMENNGLKRKVPCQSGRTRP